MEFFIKLVVYIAVGLFLLLANFWYVRSLAYTFFSPRPPKSIAPFDVVGKDDPGGKLGTMMARHLQAKLVEMAGKMEATKRKLNTNLEKAPQGTESSHLETTRDSSEFPIIPQIQFTVADRILTGKESALLLDLFGQFDLKLPVGGIDVGGLVAWAQRWFSSERVLRIGVEYKKDQVLIVGDDFPSSVVEGTDTDKVVERIAYSMLRKFVSEEFPKVVLLTPDEFKRYMDALENFADIYSRDLIRRQKAESILPGEYRDLLGEVSALRESAPDWLPLLRFNAILAEMAGDLGQARSLYSVESELTGEEGPDREWLDGKLQELAGKLEPVAKAEIPEPSFETSPHEDRNVMKILWETESAKRMLSMIGADVPVSGKHARVAVLGGLPQGWEESASDQASFLANYIETLAQVIKMVTPNARLHFDSLTGSDTGNTELVTDREMLPSLKRLIDAEPEILLIALAPLRSPEYAKILGSAAKKGILVIIAAGTKTDSPETSYVQTGLLEEAMVVSAVTTEGLPAAYSPTGENLFWAPGEKIPVYNPNRRAIEQRGGTGYAAAIAAGIAARMAAENPELDPLDLQGVLRRTATKTNETGPPVLNLRTALEKAQMESEPSGDIFEKSVLVDSEIPDGDPQGIGSVILVDRKGEILDIRVVVDIEHTYVGDLEVRLSAPDGRSVVLHDRQGGSKDDLVKEYGVATSPRLSDLIGSDIHGNWTLHAADLSRMDKGKLNRWALKIRYEPTAE